MCLEAREPLWGPPSRLCAPRVFPGLNLGVSNNIVMELDPRSSDRRPWQAAIHNESGVEVRAPRLLRKWLAGFWQVPA